MKMKCCTSLILARLAWGMLKQPALISSDLHLSVIKCKCQTYDDNIDPKLSSLHWNILVFFYALFVQWNIFGAPK